MKPCANNRKPIALLALDALATRQAAALRHHLALCEGCRRYWNEISNVTKTLSAVEPDSNLEPSSSFDRQLYGKLQAAQASSVLQKLAAWFRGPTPNLRLALPALATLMIALMAIVAALHHPAPAPAVPRMAQVSVSSGTYLAPTIANYRLIAGQSLEKLDEVLATQGNKPLPPAPIYTASGLVLPNPSL